MSELKFRAASDDHLIMGIAYSVAIAGLALYLFIGLVSSDSITRKRR